jgi:hypothetical protein
MNIYKNQSKLKAISLCIIGLSCEMLTSKAIASQNPIDQLNNIAGERAARTPPISARFSSSNISPQEFRNHHTQDWCAMDFTQSSGSDSLRRNGDLRSFYVPKEGWYNITYQHYWKSTSGRSSPYTAIGHDEGAGPTYYLKQLHLESPDTDLGIFEKTLYLRPGNTITLYTHGAPNAQFMPHFFYLDIKYMGEIRENFNQNLVQAINHLNTQLTELRQFRNLRVSDDFELVDVTPDSLQRLLRIVSRRAYGADPLPGRGTVEELCNRLNENQ